ncbi:uracil-DNA glycosylase [Bordetella petrii]|nr:uracil-DNA glycosylase [Bordetella petrii]
MTPTDTAPPAPRVNALQKFWLREIGIEKTWLQAAAPAAGAAPAPQPAVAASAAAAPAAAQAEAASASAGAPAAGVSSDASAGASPSGPGGATAAPPAATRPAAAPRPARPAPVAAPGAGTPPQAEARPVVPAHDFDALREQVIQCTACGLCNGRRHAVFGMGGRPARWMVVGEAPGEQEDRQGLPFVGRSGQLLDAMLAAVGLSREKDVFIANVIKCRPPGNRNPKPEEIAACSPYLMRQIELLKPERILVLGRFAAQTLLGTDATIGSLRGRLHTLNADDGRQIPMVVSYHPAYLLRSPVEKARAWQDLRLAMGAD